MSSLGFATIAWLAAASIPFPNLGLDPNLLRADEKIPIDQLIIVGNTETPDYLIRYVLQFGPGNKVSRADLQPAQARLRGLGLWTNPTVSFLDSIGDDGKKDVLVSIQEKPWNWLLSACHEVALFRITGELNRLNYAGLRIRDKLLDGVGKR